MAIPCGKHSICLRTQMGLLHGQSAGTAIADGFLHRRLVDAVVAGCMWYSYRRSNPDGHGRALHQSSSNSTGGCCASTPRCYGNECNSCAVRRLRNGCTLGSDGLRLSAYRTMRPLLRGRSADTLSLAVPECSWLQLLSSSSSAVCPAACVDTQFSSIA